MFILTIIRHLCHICTGSACPCLPPCQRLCKCTSTTSRCSATSLRTWTTNKLSLAMRTVSGRPPIVRRNLTGTCRARLFAFVSMDYPHFVRFLAQIFNGLSTFCSFSCTNIRRKRNNYLIFLFVSCAIQVLSEASASLCGRGNLPQYRRIRISPEGMHIVGSLPQRCARAGIFLHQENVVVKMTF